MDECKDHEAIAALVERNYRWNFMANFMDLSLFWFGNSFLSGVTILPLFVERASGSRFLVGAVAALSQAGWYLPQLLTANYVERRPLRKPIAVNVGLFSERVPLWFLALSAFVLVPSRPGPALALFFVAYAWHVLGAGAIAPAWQDMVARVIPADRRGRFFGLSSFTGSALGAAGAVLSASLLARFPFPRGFAWCFLIGATCIQASWCFLALVREPPISSAKEPVPQSTYFRGLPAVLQRDRNFRAFLASRVATGLGRMATGFVTVYAVARWHLPDSIAGTFTMTLLLSQMAAYLLLGFVADRQGHKVVLEWGALVLTAAMAFCLIAPSSAWFYLVFVALGISSAADILSSLMIVLEFTGPQDRPTYVGLANTTSGAFTALGPLLGGVLASVWGYPTLFAVALAMMLLALGILRFLVQEPREMGSLP